MQRATGQTLARTKGARKARSPGEECRAAGSATEETTRAPMRIFFARIDRAVIVRLSKYLVCLAAMLPACSAESKSITAGGVRDGHSGAGGVNAAGAANGGSAIDGGGGTTGGQRSADSGGASTGGTLTGGASTGTSGADASPSGVDAAKPPACDALAGCSDAVAPDGDASDAVCGAPTGTALTVFRGMVAGFRACYERGLSADPTMRGSIVMSIHIGPGGEVNSVDVEVMSGNLSDAVLDCLKIRAMASQFDAPDGATACLQFRVSFTPRQ